MVGDGTGGAGGVSGEEYGVSGAGQKDDAVVATAMPGMQFSFSKVAQYARCPQQYEYQRLLLLPSPSSSGIHSRAYSTTRTLLVGYS
jgi:hypothetical protein